MRYIIYGLQDPVSGHLRYIGKSSTGLYRANSHIYPSVLAQTPNTYKVNWINSLLKQNLKPISFVIQECNSYESLFEAEIQWISYFKSLGCPLTNSTVGGEGIKGYKFTTSSLEKLRQSHRAYIMPQFQKDKISKANKISMLGNKNGLGAKKTPEQCYQISLRCKGIKLSAEACNNIRISKEKSKVMDSLGREFRSAKQASILLKINYSNIIQVILEKRKTAGGLGFRRI